MDRPEIFRALAMIALIATFIAALAVLNRHPAPIAPDLSSTPTLNDLTAELSRCNTLGPKDAEDARCNAVWAENRRRFFGRPARSVPPETAPATPSSQDATSGDVR